MTVSLMEDVAVTVCVCVRDGVTDFELVGVFDVVGVTDLVGDCVVVTVHVIVVLVVAEELKDVDTVALRVTDGVRDTEGAGNESVKHSK